MRFLFVMDPLDQLDLRWDTSLCLLRELTRRGHECWAVDAGELWAEKKGDFAWTRRLAPNRKSGYVTSAPAARNLQSFHCILIRKDPPFDTAYLHMTYLLERVADDRVPVVNHPRGIRNTNEKIIGLAFPKWIPETVVTSLPSRILEFQRQIKDDIILKPCDQKGGKGIVLLARGQAGAKSLVFRATNRGKKVVVAQRFLRTRSRGDKRILILNGKILAAFEKHPRKGEFRSNLSRGGTFHPTKITAKEKQLVKEMKPYLLREGLQFVGIDVMAEKLIEVNVTSPAGLVETKILDPRSSAVSSWADFLEDLVSD